MQQLRRNRAPIPTAKVTTSTEIIPRDVLFGNPEYASPIISPDGKLLAYLRPDADGVLNVWCTATHGALPPTPWLAAPRLPLDA